MGEWEILELEPTADAAAIKKAYFKKCKEQPPADRAGLAMLTQAYNEALQKVTGETASEGQLVSSAIDQMLQLEQEDAEPMDPASQAAHFMARVKTLYKDVLLRHNEKEWRQLLASEMLYCDPVKEQVCDQLLHFLAARSLPQPIWKLLDECFSWTEKKEQLYGRFPAYIVSFVLGEIEGSNRFETRLGQPWPGISIVLTGIGTAGLLTGFNQTSPGLQGAGAAVAILFLLMGIYVFYGRIVTISNYDKTVVVKTLAGKQTWRFDEIKGFAVTEPIAAILRVFFIIPIGRQTVQTIAVYVYDPKGTLRPPVMLKYDESLVRILARYFPYLDGVKLGN